ncbi:P-loop containing nucleoside triphosphate hydrolase protein, partial [Pavlovales sp. CCMP2436]
MAAARRLMTARVALACSMAVLLAWAPGASGLAREGLARVPRAHVSMAPKKGKGKSGSMAEKDQRQAKQAGAQRSFEAEAASKFMFTMQRLTKKLPDGSRTLLKDINLCFYPGAKIGVVGLNGSGKSTLLKIMAGVDTEVPDSFADPLSPRSSFKPRPNPKILNPPPSPPFDGTAKPMEGVSIGYLAQEPELTGATVAECMAHAMTDGQKLLDRFTELSARLSEPMGDAEMQKILDETARVQDQIEAGNLWEIDRVMERAMEALRCPPAEAVTAVLSGGEKRRVALAALLIQVYIIYAALLIQGHDMLLLDEPTNHLDAASVGWLETFLDTFKKGTVVAITHDRYFLENTCKWILELDRGEGVPFEGSYSGWLERKAAKLVQEKKDDSALTRTIQ